MSVAFVSTWPPRQCGIAGYTRRLVGGLRATGLGPVHVIAERGGEPEERPEGQVLVAYDRHSAFAPDIRAAAQRLDASIVHFQHAPDLFGLGEALLDTLRGLRADGRRVGLTLHTVHTRRSGLLERQLKVAQAHRAIAQLAHGLVVHSQGAKQVLCDQGVPPHKITVIPHGTDAPQRGDAQRGRALMGFDERARVVLAFGFIHAQKNLQVLVRALAQARRSDPLLHLVLAGKPGGDAWYNRAYLRGLRLLAVRHGVQRQVQILQRFIPEDDVLDLHAAARLVALPYRQGYASASGVVHGALAMGRPLLCAAGPKFEEVGEHIDPALLIDAGDVRAWAQGMVRLSGDEAWRAEVLQKIEAYAQATTWPKVAQAHGAAWAGWA